MHAKPGRLHTTSILVHTSLLNAPQPLDLSVCVALCVGGQLWSDRGMENAQHASRVTLHPSAIRIHPPLNSQECAALVAVDEGIACARDERDEREEGEGG